MTVPVGDSPFIPTPTPSLKRNQEPISAAPAEIWDPSPYRAPSAFHSAPLWPLFRVHLWVCLV